jgi:TonB family protein
MKNRIAVALFVLLAMLMFAPGRLPAQEASEGTRKIVTKVSPQYPPVARRLGLQGVVKMEVVIAPNGTVKSVEVIGGHPMLADSAQNVVRQWKWEPASHETHQTVEMSFKF